ncbi:hypothetical protein HYDPIDRAFT_119344 [Hydnomerulius pinastri MD-312]|uniref:Uncharacterized protein n=1 Tax=Hydnomerulius pinastri MD-312 TaxID=994086 RepID=A0A0C9VZ33_9AGAM|nr:hypothetical protein HYDPIDRAFT_119344 [Hydnomerulius pinastri MD-312]
MSTRQCPGCSRCFTYSGLGYHLSQTGDPQCIAIFHEMQLGVLDSDDYDDSPDISGSEEGSETEEIEMQDRLEYTRRMTKARTKMGVVLLLLSARPHRNHPSKAQLSPL